MNDRIAELMKEARAGKITVGEFRKKAEQYYDIELPQTNGDTLSNAADAHYLMKKSGFNFREYFKRVREITNSMQILEEEHVAEKYAITHGLSGKLTV